MDIFTRLAATETTDMYVKNYDKALLNLGVDKKLRDNFKSIFQDTCAQLLGTTKATVLFENLQQLKVWISLIDPKTLKKENKTQFEQIKKVTNNIQWITELAKGNKDSLNDLEKVINNINSSQRNSGIDLDLHLNQCKYALETLGISEDESNNVAQRIQKIWNAILEGKNIAGKSIDIETYAKNLEDIIEKLQSFADDNYTKAIRQQNEDVYNEVLAKLKLYIRIVIQADVTKFNNLYKKLQAYLKYIEQNPNRASIYIKFDTLNFRLLTENETVDNHTQFKQFYTKVYNCFDNFSLDENDIIMLASVLNNANTLLSRSNVTVLAPKSCGSLILNTQSIIDNPKYIKSSASTINKIIEKFKEEYQTNKKKYNNFLSPELQQQFKKTDNVFGSDIVESIQEAFSNGTIDSKKAKDILDILVNLTRAFNNLRNKDKATKKMSLTVASRLNAYDNELINTIKQNILNIDQLNSYYNSYVNDPGSNWRINRKKITSNLYTNVEDPEEERDKYRRIMNKIDRAEKENKSAHLTSDEIAFKQNYEGWIDSKDENLRQISPDVKRSSDRRTDLDDFFQFPQTSSIAACLREIHRVLTDKNIKKSSPAIKLASDLLLIQENSEILDNFIKERKAEGYRLPKYMEDYKNIICRFILLAEKTPDILRQAANTISTYDEDNNICAHPRAIFDSFKKTITQANKDYKQGKTPEQHNREFDENQDIKTNISFENINEKDRLYIQQVSYLDKNGEKKTGVISLVKGKDNIHINAYNAMKYLRGKKFQATDEDRLTDFISTIPIERNGRTIFVVSPWDNLIQKLINPAIENDTDLLRKFKNQEKIISKFRSYFDRTIHNAKATYEEDKQYKVFTDFKEKFNIDDNQLKFLAPYRSNDRYIDRFGCVSILMVAYERAMQELSDSITDYIGSSAGKDDVKVEFSVSELENTKEAQDKIIAILNKVVEDFTAHGVKPASVLQKYETNNLKSNDKYKKCIGLLAQYPSKNFIDQFNEKCSLLRSKNQELSYAVKNKYIYATVQAVLLIFGGMASASVDENARKADKYTFDLFGGIRSSLTNPRMTPEQRTDLKATIQELKSRKEYLDKVQQELAELQQLPQDIDKEDEVRSKPHYEQLKQFKVKRNLI